MIANLTTPLIGIVSTTAIGRLGDATLLGGVAMASVLFDCLFWLFGFLRMSTLAFTAQSLGAGETRDLHAILLRGLIASGLVGVTLIVLQIPLAAILFAAMGGSEGVTRAAETYFLIRIWSAPLALANYVVLGWLIGQARATLALSVQIAINVINMIATVLLVLVADLGIAGAAIAAVIAETAGLAIGGVIAQRLTRGHPPLSRATLFDREKLLRMLTVNRDIMIRTAALIAAWLLFTAQGARSGDAILAANAVLNNFLLVSAFFLDGLANAAQQLCGSAYGARSRDQFTTRGAACAVLGICLCSGGCRHLRAVRPCTDRLHDGKRGCAAAGARLPAFRDRFAAAVGVRIRLRRHLYRRDLGARHAQSDAGLACDLPRRLVRAARLRQCGAVGGAAGALRRARRPAGAGLSAAAEAVVRLVVRGEIE